MTNVFFYYIIDVNYLRKEYNMKKSMIGGEGKTGGDMHSGKPSEIITHITSEHSKPNIFHGEPGEKNHPKASSKYANCGKSSDCGY